ncbi:helix-turn-helix domain-containing protein [Chitinophagaceae bacterium MMS25-I14]
MEGAFLLEISKKIKKHRTDKRLTVQELADRSGVTKGLISQIENGRSIPSLPVLFSIIKSLEVAIGDFFAEIASDAEPAPVIVRKKGEYESFQKEDAVGFFYQRILTRNMADATVDIVLLRLEPGSSRPKVETEAFEYKYIISGKVEYQINGHSYVLEEGDSLFFDGRLPHVPHTIGDAPAIMLIVYFFEQE